MPPMTIGHLLRRMVVRAREDPRSLNLSGRALSMIRGALNPTLLRVRTRTTAYDPGRTLLITGYPRSGTTWLAEIVSSLPHTALLFEPLDLRKVRQARSAGLDWENFRLAGEDWPEGEDFFEKLFQGLVLTRWTTSHIPVTRAWSVDRWVIKLVRANQMLGWIVRNFDLPPPVLLVRHPCAVYDSWIRRGWPLPRGGSAPAYRFLDTYPQLRSVVLRLETPEERFAAQWAMHHRTPFDQLEPSDYQLCFYERLRSDGPSEVRRIFDRWGFPTPDGLDERLGRPSAKASGALQVDDRAGWRDRLDPTVVKRIMGVVRQFDLDLYNESESK